MHLPSEIIFFVLTHNEPFLLQIRAKRTYDFMLSYHLCLSYFKQHFIPLTGVTYEGVAEFVYLGTLISNDNSVEKEIQRRILAGNRTDFATVSLFRSRLLSRATTIILYKTLIRPIVSCGAEAWTVTKKEEQALLIFERKIFRRIYGPKYENEK